MILDAIWTSVFHQFSRPSGTSCFGTSIKRKPCFYRSRPLVLVHNFFTNFVFFPEPRLDLIFHHFGSILSETCRFWEPKGFPIWNQNLPKNKHFCQGSILELHGPFWHHFGTLFVPIGRTLGSISPHLAHCWPHFG